MILCDRSFSERRGVARVLTQFASVLWRSLWLRRGSAARELLQTVAFVPRRSSDHSIVLRHFHCTIGDLERVSIFLLFVERQRQAENDHRIRIAGECIDRLLQILLRRRKFSFLNSIVPMIEYALERSRPL